MVTKRSCFFIIVLWTLLFLVLLFLWGGLGIKITDKMVPARDGLLRLAPIPGNETINQSSQSNSSARMSSYDVVESVTLSESYNASYVLALSLEEQLSAASHSLFTLGPLAADWNAQLVEPVVLMSRIFGIEGIFPPNSKLYDGKTSIRLSEIYNISEVRRIFHTHVSPPVNMVSFEEFLATASRTVTLLHFTGFSEKNNDWVLNRTESDSVRKHFQTSNSTAPFDCTHMDGASDLAHRVKTKLNEKSRTVHPAFVVEKVLCFDPAIVYRTDVISQHTSLPGTIVFTEWRGCGCTFESCSIHFEHNSEHHKNPDSFRYALLHEASIRDFPVRFMYRLHNPSITKVAEEYLETVNKRPPFLSIHMRIERLLRDGCNLTLCLDSLKQTVDRLSRIHNLKKTLLITDTGSEYGSITCGKRCEQGNTNLQFILSKLSSFNFTVSSCNPKLLNGTENSAYVSLVEMNMLSIGEKLVMVGRGGFQKILRDKYLSLNHTEEDVYHICNSTKPYVQEHNVLTKQHHSMQ